MKNHENNMMKKKPSKSNSMDKKGAGNEDEDKDVESSPLRFWSPLRSDQFDPPPPPLASQPPQPPPLQQPPPEVFHQSKALTVIEKPPPAFSPLRSPRKEPAKPVFTSAPPQPESVAVKAQSQSPVMVQFNRSIKDELTAVTKVEQGRGVRDGEGGAVNSILWRSSREKLLKKVELGFRVLEAVLCLISFSVLAADKTQGWSGDSFDRYKEYRYCVAINVIAFVYAGFQACNLAYKWVAGKRTLAYLLMSASSSAATRVDDWVSNWGKDKFTEMATASISVSFLAFFAFATSSLISGYNLVACD
ncbi:Casparian strip membrane protein domain [Dillenia turbinata]|uniref:CASP-like protein n=1 Tax=Dillenia turbinata TaxID=194707 RepID=A0AAN8Z1B9_9MAGN